MPGKNATPLIGWHSKDPTLKPWLEAERERRGMGSMRELLDEALAQYRENVSRPGTGLPAGENAARSEAVLRRSDESDAAQHARGAVPPDDPGLPLRYFDPAGQQRQPPEHGLHLYRGVVVQLG